MTTIRCTLGVLSFLSAYVSAPALAQQATPVASPTPVESPAPTPAATTVPTPAPGPSEEKSAVPVNRHDSGFFLGLGTGYQEPTGSFYGNNVSSGSAISMLLGWRFNRHIAFESNLLHGRSRVRTIFGDGEVSLGTLSFGARGFYRVTDKVETTAYLGWGVGSFGNSAVDYSGQTVDWALGVRVHPFEVFFLSTDIRYSYLRFREFEINDGQTTESGSLGHRRHGDIFAIVLGGGLQF